MAIKTIRERRLAYIIGNTYGFFPNANIKTEQTQLADGINIGFFANRSNRVVCSIKFNADEVEKALEI